MLAIVRKGWGMKASSLRRVILLILVAGAAAYLVVRHARPSPRDAAVARCMDGGDGDMFTSRQLCEERHAPGAGAAPASGD